MSDLIGGERRVSRRYQLELGVRFQYVAGGTQHSGQGVTSDLSRSGVLLQTEEPPPAGAAIELHIDWPYLLQGVCPLEIFMKGKVVSVSKRGVVVKCSGPEFRTRGDRSFSESGYSPKISLVA
jgi:hypothetical protein